MGLFRSRTAGASDSSGCVVWTGNLSGSGYAYFKHVPAYRWLWEQYHGPVPAGLELDHLCNNRACVNLLHLEPVTHAENLRRARERNAAAA